MIRLFPKGYLVHFGLLFLASLKLQENPFWGNFKLLVLEKICAVICRSCASTAEVAIEKPLAAYGLPGRPRTSILERFWRRLPCLPPIALTPAAPPPVGSEILDRLPPQNLEAEKGVLGSLLLDPNLCDDVALILRPDDFYADANQKLYAHLLAMHDEGKRIDVMLLVERLTQAGDLEAVGGAAYMAEVAHSVPYAANAVYYAEIVRDKATLRALIHASTEILRDAYEPTLDPAGDGRPGRGADLRRPRPAEHRPDHHRPRPDDRGVRPHRRPAGARRGRGRSHRLHRTWIT